MAGASSRNAQFRCIFIASDCSFSLLQSFRDIFGACQSDKFIRRLV